MTHSSMKYLLTVVRGMAMGLADAVPGVSGGTVALLLGFYDRLIEEVAAACGLLKRPFSGDAWRRTWQACLFLVPLGIGVVVMLVLATKALVGDKLPDEPDADVLRQLMNSHDGWLINPDKAPWVFAAFFGAVIATIPLPWQQRSAHQSIDWLSAIVATILAGSIALLPALGGSEHPVAIVGAGFLALTVMLLPGISGSLALLVLGMYHIIAGSLHTLQFDIIMWFMIGCIASALIAIPALRWSLKHHHDRIMPALSGLLLGSLVALWPWKTHYVHKAHDVLGPVLPIIPSEQILGPCVVALAVWQAVRLLELRARKNL